MKVECPQCGQHYEVDASMLDRHFRCTECKTFFLGLNAKTVKESKFVRADQTSEENDPESAVGAAAVNAEQKTGSVDTAASGAGVDAVPAPPQVEAGVLDSKTAEKIAAAFPVEEMVIREHTPMKAINVERWLASAAIVLSVFMIVLLWICNSRLNDVSERIRAIRSENTALQGKLEQQEQKITELSNRLAVADGKVDQLERWSRDVNTKMQDDSLRQQLDEHGKNMAKLELRLAELIPTVKKLEKQLDDIRSEQRQIISSGGKRSDVTAVDLDDGSDRRRRR